MLIGLPFSKAVVSIAFVGLILISIFSFFQIKRTDDFSRRTILFRRLKSSVHLQYLPIVLFLALAISLFYSADFTKSGKILLSYIEFLVLPFIFIINQQLIKERLKNYLNIFIGATMLAAFITLLFFLLPQQLVQTIAETLPLLKDYVVHEKEMAFGVYSPFTDRLQFSYLIGVAVLILFWRLFEHYDNPPPYGSTFSSPKKAKRLQRGKVPLQENTLELNNLLSFLNKTLLYRIIQLLILLGTLLILGARGAQISFLIASIIWPIGVYFYWIHPKFVKRFNVVFSYGLLISIIFVCLIIIPFFAYKSIPAVHVRYDQMRWEIGTFEDGTYQEYDYIHFTSIRRVLSWKNSWAIIQENPILGVGVGDYQMEMEKQYAKDDLGFPVNTQSQYLYYWAVSGLMGLVAFLLLIGVPFFYFFKQKDFPLKLLGTSFLVFYSLIFLFDAPLNFQVGAMTFLVFYGFLIMTLSQHPKNV